MRGGRNCVFFTQQLLEKRRIGLWGGRFLIASKGSIVNPDNATEGGIPLLRFPGRRIARGGKARVPVWDYRSVEKLFGSGEQGEVPSVPVALGGYGTLSR